MIVPPNPKIGDIVTLHRNHPHVSEYNPYLHTDLYFLQYLGDNTFFVVDKDHIPCDTS